MAAVDKETGDQVPATTRRGSRWGLMLVLLLVLGAGGGGGAFYLNDMHGGDRADRKPTSHYLALQPELVVNFRDAGRVRYLQAGLELMAYEPRALDAAKEHMPVIRHELLMLLSDQEFETLIGSEGKEALRIEAREIVRDLLAERANHHEIEDVFFTSFVMQ